MYLVIDLVSWYVNPFRLFAETSKCIETLSSFGLSYDYDTINICSSAWLRLLLFLKYFLLILISVVDVVVVVKLLQLPTLYYKRVKIEVGYNIIYIEFLLCMHFGKMQGVINDLVSCRFSRWVKIIPDPPSLKLVALNALDRS